MFYYAIILTLGLAKSILHTMIDLADQLFSKWQVLLLNRFYILLDLIFFAVNLAAAVADLNPSLRVGLLDADVFGPSVPLMMNLNEEPLLTSGNNLNVKRYNMKLFY